MKILLKLYILQIKGSIRHAFSKVSSTIFTLAIILIYGGLTVYSLCNPEISLSMVHLNDINATIMMNLGFSAVMILSLLLQKKMSMLTENDAYMLFTGPFKRSQIMQFIMLSVIMSALLFSLLNVMLIAMLGRSIAFDWVFLLLLLVSQFMLYYFFLITQYYIYLLGIENEGKKKIKNVIVAVLGFACVGLFLIVLAQNDFQFQEGFQAFLNSELFYCIPILGWVKMVLISYVAQNYVLLCLGLGLLFASCGVVYYLIMHYQCDFVEQAMIDAEEFSKRYRMMKEGKATSLKDEKVRNVKSSFKEGAKAIFSKNMLLMKKTHSFISIQEVFVIVVYLVISLFMDMGFAFFCYMLVFWMFSMIMNSDFMKDMKNYQIYLIPDKPLKKLMYTMLPTFFNLELLLWFFLILSGLIFQETFITILQYGVMLSGYGILFMSGAVVSLRILKSRNSMVMTQMLGMLIMIIAAIPGTILLIYLMSSGTLTLELMNWITVGNLAINFVIAFILLCSCKNMMNGREIISE